MKLTDIKRGSTKRRYVLLNRKGQLDSVGGSLNLFPNKKIAQSWQKGSPWWVEVVPVLVTYRLDD